MESQAQRLIQIRSKGLRVSQMNRLPELHRCNQAIGGDGDADFIFLFLPSATSSLVMEFILEHFLLPSPLTACHSTKMETTKLVTSFDCFSVFWLIVLDACMHLNRIYFIYTFFALVFTRSLGQPCSFHLALYGKC